MAVLAFLSCANGSYTTPNIEGLLDKRRKNFFQCFTKKLEDPQHIDPLSFLTPGFQRLAPIFHAVAPAINGNHLRMMKQPVEQGGGKNLVLECVIMPFSLIVLLVEAILGAV